MTGTCMSAPKRIALFGGTFDPVHLGHVHIARAARETAELDEVRFLPCRISPHKLGQVSAPAEDRLAMLRLATESLPWALVDDFELHSPEPSYSYVTAEALTRRLPDVEWFWIMGTDQWEALPRWKHPERLAACVTFLVLSRAPVIPRRRPPFVRVWQRANRCRHGSIPPWRTTSRATDCIDPAGHLPLKRTQPRMDTGDRCHPPLIASYL
jgi:nicotinate (nicotinamide) nucleotide adenylyltransferase